MALLAELRRYPGTESAQSHTNDTIAVPMELELDGIVLSMLSTTTVFGTPMDITLAELALEAFVPADAATAHHLQQLAAG